MTTATDRYTADLIRALAEGVTERAQHMDLEAAGAVDDVARAMLAVLPAAVAHPWAAQIGPFHDTRGVQALLGITRQAVSERVTRRTLLGTRTTSGRIVYPTFQFVGREVAPQVKAVLAEFKDVPVDGWAIAAWFTVPAEALGGATPAGWLRDGRDVDPVLDLARDAAARWSAP